MTTPAFNTELPFQFSTCWRKTLKTWNFIITYIVFRGERVKVILYLHMSLPPPFFQVEKIVLFLQGEVTFEPKYILKPLSFFVCGIFT